MRHAIIDDSLVIGIVDVPSDEVFQHLAKRFLVVDVDNVYPAPQIGWKFNGSQITKPDGSIGIDWRITKLAMRNRFELGELLAITAAIDSSTLIKVLMDNLSLAIYIDLSLTSTQAGLMALAQAGLLTPQRVNIILTTPPAPDELAFGGG